MSDYYDREGRPLDRTEWAQLNEDRDYLRVARTPVGRSLLVSTIWLGLNHQWRPGLPPVIFETMVFGRWTFGELAMWRYGTEVEARAGHVDATLWAQQHYHGLVKHARDEKRQRMRWDLQTLADAKVHTGEDPYAQMVQASAKLLRLRPRRGPTMD